MISGWPGRLESGPMRVGLVRHGESEGNAASTLQGCRMDAPLSLRGRRQAEALAIRLAVEEIDRFFASPLKRARETAVIVEAPHGVGLAVDRDLVEFDWGAWTGRPLDDQLEREVEAIRVRWRAGDVDLSPPNGESPSRAAARADHFLSRLAAAGASAPVVVAHGRFNRILISRLVGRDLCRMDEVRQRNGSLSLFEWDGASPARPILLDDVSHLQKELAVALGRSDSLVRG